MTFGLTNVLGNFQGTLDILFRGLNWWTQIVYIENVIKFYNSCDYRLNNVSLVLSTLCKACVSLNLRNCWVFTEEVKYLKHTIRPGLSTIDETQISKFRLSQQPF